MDDEPHRPRQHVHAAYGRNGAEGPARVFPRSGQAKTIKISVKQEEGDAIAGIRIYSNPHSIWDSPQCVLVSREAFCNMVADRADRGVYYHANGYYIIRAEITDTGEVWARVVPEDPCLEASLQAIQKKYEDTKKEPEYRIFEKKMLDAYHQRPV
jgi:hypothetical protein